MKIPRNSRGMHLHYLEHFGASVDFEPNSDPFEEVGMLKLTLAVVMINL